MKRLIVLSGGHPYEAEPFAELLASLDGWAVEHFVHPEAEAAVAQGALTDADTILFYDMPGYEFADGVVTTHPPSEAFKQALTGFFERGGGAVAMHHALAGWADWPEWGERVGGRFLYRAEPPLLDSGYRHDVDYQAVVVAPDHPVLAGLPRRFPMRDELYLAEVREDDVTPLLRADHAFVADNFYSAANAVGGRMFDNTDWPHPPASDLIAWEQGPIVFLQPGDGPATYANPYFRRLLTNALAHVAA